MADHRATRRVVPRPLGSFEDAPPVPDPADPPAEETESEEPPASPAGTRPPLEPDSGAALTARQRTWILERRRVEQDRAEASRSGTDPST